MTPSAVNLVTRWIVLGPFLAWGIWEIVLLALRARGWPVRLVSMEARAIASSGLPTFAYALAGLVAHFFITWGRVPWDGWLRGALGALWWAGLVAYLVADWLDPDRAAWPLVTQYIRHPAGAALIGAVAAWLLFPQASVWTPGGTP
jgi:predicted membrane protein